MIALCETNVPIDSDNHTTLLSARPHSCEAENYAETTWIDFSSTINPLGTPSSFIHAVEKAVNEEKLSYSSRDTMHSLTSALAHYYNLSESSFLIGSGVANLLESVVSSFAPCNVGVAMPGFIEHITIAERAHHHVVKITSPAGFAVPDASDARHRHIHFDAAILANPNYPTSRLLPKPTLMSYLKTCDWVVVDERFIELTLSGESMVSLTESYPNLVVIRSFCETFAMPCIPLSYCIAHPTTIASLARVCDQSTLPPFAEILGELAAAQAESLESTREFLDSEIPWFQCMLDLIPGITVFPAEANFVMCALNPKAHTTSPICTTAALDAHLKEKGFLIQRLDNISGLTNDRYFCVAVRTHEDNKKFVTALANTMTGQ